MFDFVKMLAGGGIVLVNNQMDVNSNLSDIPSGIASRLGFTVDLLSFVRNSWSVLEPYPGTALTAFGAVGGAVMSLSSSILTVKVIDKIWRALKKGDYESAKVLSATSLPSFASYACLSYGMLVQKVAILANASHIASAGGALLVHALPVMAIFNFLSGTYTNYTTSELKNTLDQNFSKAPKMTIDEAIEFIKAESWFDQVKDGLACNKDPNSPEEKKAFIQEAYTKYLSYKVKSEKQDFIEKTSEECVDNVIDFLDKKNHSPEELSRIISLINESLARTKAIQQIKKICEDENSSAAFARQTSDECVKFVGTQRDCIAWSSEQRKKDFLCTVYEANYRTSLNARFLQIVAVIGMVASVVLFTTMASYASFIFIPGSLVWMVLDSSRLSKKIGNWFWEHRKVYVLPQNIQKLTDEPEKSKSAFWLQTIAAGIFAPVWMPPAVLYYEGKRVYRNFTDYFEHREAAALYAPI